MTTDTHNTVLTRELRATDLEWASLVEIASADSDFPLGLADGHTKNLATSAALA